MSLTTSCSPPMLTPPLVTSTSARISWSSMAAISARGSSRHGAVPKAMLPGLARRRREHEAVGLPDPARRYRRAGLRKLVARGKHRPPAAAGGPGRPSGRPPRAARAGRARAVLPRRAPGRPPDRSSPARRIACPGSAAWRTSTLADPAVGPLDRHHRVGARGQLRTRHYPHRRARLSPRRRRCHRPRPRPRRAGSPDCPTWRLRRRRRAPRTRPSPSCRMTAEAG